MERRAFLLADEEDEMQRRVTWPGIAVVWGLLILGVAAHGAEESVPLDKIPKPVMDAVKTRFNNAKATAASTETEKGKRLYEVTIKPKGQNIDVTVTPEGEIVLIEKEISTKGLPAAVSRALKDRYPKAKYRIIEEIIKVDNKVEKLDHYETLLVKPDKQAVEVEVSAEGKIMNEEKKSSDKPD
jgi:uncharacterized membrane protein YkoI